ncbi:MAG: cell division protein FtsA [Bacilli bacterium]|nr:cell division protein FtsA [Bacilli bacterium]
MNNKNIYTSVDIGTNTIKIVVCELFGNKLNLLAATSVASQGIKKGVVVDSALATNSLKKALKEIEDMLGVSIKKVIASIPSYNADYIYSKHEELISSDEKVNIDEKVINLLFKETIKEKLPQLKEVVTLLPVDFIIDDEKAVKDPKGLLGKKIALRSVLVATPKKNIYSVVSLFENIGVEVVDITLNAIGDMYTFKSKETDESIGIIVNMGEEVTQVSLYNKSIIVKSTNIQLGSKNIDNDLAYIYKITKNEARKIKEKFALAHKMYASVNDIYELTDVNGEKVRINQFEASEIVMARLEQILNLVKNEINTLTNKKISYIIVTGGTSNMDNFNLIADEILGKGTIIGDVKLIGARHNKYSSVIGNIVYFINKLKLRGKSYSMFDSDDIEALSTRKKSIINVSNDSMLGKVFGYFGSE